jgi:hypothetical protein
VANMANAIKKISVQRGYDVTEYVLNVFGGAGGQHACAVADALGHDPGAHPPAGRRAVRVRDRAGRHHRHARAGRRGAADPRRPRERARDPGPARAGRPRRGGRRGRAAGADHRHAPGAPALPGHRHRGHRRCRLAGGHDRRVRRPSTPAASPS